jgi:hypothetical protein
LVLSLDRGADFFVHVDAKETVEQFKSDDFGPNVHFLADRVRVYWGGFSIVEATLKLMQAATEQGMYERHVLLNGLDYPIKPTSFIVDTLLSDPNREFIRFFDIEKADPRYLEGVTRYYFFDAPRLLANRFFDARQRAQRLLRWLPKRLVRPYTHCFGHMQWALTGQCVQFILDFAETHQDLRRFYKYSFAPDERFIHTIVANSPFCDRAGGIEAFEEFGTYRMANFHHIDRSLNKVFTNADYEELAHSSKLFVKKITTAESLELIDLIDKNLRNESDSP